MKTMEISDFSISSNLNYYLWTTDQIWGYLHFQRPFYARLKFWEIYSKSIGLTKIEKKWVNHLHGNLYNF